MLIEEGTAHRSRASCIRASEPEIAFLLKKPLPGDVTAAEALASVEAIAPALEIIDSRYRDFKFTLPEVIADNASSSGFVVGAVERPARGLQQSRPHAEHRRPRRAGRFDGGNPRSPASVAGRRCALSAAAGEPLQAGWVVMAGGATPAEWLKPGQYVSIEMERLGSAGFHMEE